jgi:hypothetical protein
MTNTTDVLMERDGVQTEVCNDASVGIMEALGWALVEKEDQAAQGAMKVADIKAALIAKGITPPEGAKKAELQALLDAA